VPPVDTMIRRVPASHVAQSTFPTRWVAVMDSLPQPCCSVGASI
jgi:hypothetical protein